MESKNPPFLNGEMIAIMTSMTPMIKEFGLHLMNHGAQTTSYAHLESLKTDLTRLLKLIQEAQARENPHGLFSAFSP